MPGAKEMKMNRFRTTAVPVACAFLMGANLMLLTSRPGHAGSSVGSGSKPFQRTLFVSASSPVSTFTVPAGYRLDIQHVNTFAFTDRGSDQLTALDLTTQFEGEEADDTFPLSLFAVRNGYYQYASDAQPILYAGPGTKLFVGYENTDASDLDAFARVTLTGRFVPVP